MAVEATCGLVEIRIRESLDPGHGFRAGADPRYAENPGERTLAKNDRPSGASAIGTSDAVRESGTTCLESTGRQDALSAAMATAAASAKQMTKRRPCTRSGVFCKWQRAGKV
jgi:hypothetical protein